MKKSIIRTVAMIMLFALIFTNAPINCIQVNASTSDTKENAIVKKPAAVKGLKKVKMSTSFCGSREYSYSKWAGRYIMLNGCNTCVVKIKYNKVKGADGYQILVYRTNRLPDGKTPIVYAKTSKKTTYTVKNLVPNVKYTIKVRAYKKGKNGKMVYGKFKALRIKTSGSRAGTYYVCDTCGACMPAIIFHKEGHVNITWKFHREIHAGGTYNFY